MIRKYILVNTLCNCGVYSLLDFVTQCYEFYRDDVLRWKDRVKYNKQLWFDVYYSKNGGFDFALFRAIRNLYVHDLDVEASELCETIKNLSVNEIRLACKYFNVEVDDACIKEVITRCERSLDNMLETFA